VIDEMEVEDEEDEEESAAVATEAEGWRLHLSSRCQSGYRGVRMQPSGRFRAMTQAGGNVVYLGQFDSAMEAAVAYARHMQSVGGGGEEEEEKEEEKEEEVMVVVVVEEKESSYNKAIKY
jgi:hypothetical protein